MPRHVVVRGERKEPLAAEKLYAVLLTLARLKLEAAERAEREEKNKAAGGPGGETQP